jgi:integrase
LPEHRQKLTVRSVQSAAVGFTWDSVLPGFGLRVLESGRRSFIIRYRTQSGTSRLLTLGTAEELHPEEAREMAREHFKEVRQGNDPKADRQAKRKAARLEDLKTKFLSDHASQKKPGTERNYEIAWRRHIMPTLKNPAVCDITTSDLIELRKKLAHRPVNCNRVFEVLRKAFDLAEKWKMRPKGTNPCDDIEDFPESERELILEPEQVAALWAALMSQRWMPNFATLIRLLMLTGCRCGEWRLARWSWVDLPNARLRLPDSGSKNGARDVPLAPEVVEILKALPRTSVFVLPGKKGGPISGHQRMWRNLRDHAELPKETRMHDIRHTVASYAHKHAGATQRDVADLLGHKQMSTAARYIHGPNSEKHQNAGKASATILNLVSVAKDRGAEPTKANA